MATSYYNISLDHLADHLIYLSSSSSFWFSLNSSYEHDLHPMLCAAKVTGAGEKEITKHLSAHLSKGFCPTR